MPKFYCTFCGYSFAPRNNVRVEPPKSCPYCNREGALVKEQTSNELLDDL